MAWRKPTLEDISATLSHDEIEAFRQSADFGGADPVEALIGRTAELVRGYCRANRALRMSPMRGTIPESLISPAMDYAAYDILKRMPVPVAEHRRLAREQAIDLFGRVGKNEVTPESDGLSDDAGSGVEPKVSVPPRRLG